MTATTPTTIQGVSILSGQKKRGDVFELALSSDGIEVRRPERPVQQMTWDRVSEWEIEERKGYVLLTLRGQGATTPLVVPGWTLDDLEILMRDITANGAAPEADAPEPVVTDEKDGRTSTPVTVVATSVPATSDPVPTPAPASAPTSEAPAPESDAPPAAPTRTERRQRAGRGAGSRRLSWRAVMTVALLGVLATAVLLVLLQSAGIINWSFLGPVA